jgi:hypothetical protein
LLREPSGDFANMGKNSAIAQLEDYAGPAEAA